MFFMQNIEIFEEAMARILASLYESFPVPKNINFIEIISIYQPTIPLKRNQTYEDIYLYTFCFLESEGYIKYAAAGNQDSTNFRGCILTSKGFTKLHHVPNPLDEQKASIAEQFQKVRDNVVIDSSKAIIANAVKAFFATGT
jgi:hypothetical protein